MKKSLFFMMLLIFSIALCACSGDTKKDGQATDNQSQGQTADSDSVSYGGEIVVGISQDLDSLDPHKAVAAGTKEVLYNIFEGLIKVDKDGNFVPAVAASYEITDGGLKYNFKLRENVKFHNGKVVTADDVIYSLKRAAGMLETSDPEVAIVSAFSIISEINKTDDGVQVVLTEPNTELIGFFTSSIIPCDYDNQAKAPVGTGPFKFVSFEPLVSFKMEKNTDYYGNQAYLDKVTFKITSGGDSAFMELLAGSIDIFPYLTNEQAAQLQGKMDVLDGSMNLVQALFLNNAVKPFDDVRVRQAVCYALDRNEIINVTAGGRGDAIGTNMFPSFAKYYDASLVNNYNTNLDKAKELLKEAGYEQGFTFTIKIPSNYDFHVKTGQVIVSQLAKVGIKAEIQLVDWGTWLSDVYKGRQHDATIIGLDSQMAPSDVLRFYPTESGKNFMNYSNAQFDEVFAKAKAAVDENEKATLYKQCEKILTEDAAAAYIQSPAQLVAVNPKLGGYTFYPIYVQDMSTVYFKK
ncbi:MAG: ABC transporter substrate-binding protein [Lachnospiraceae bacterium]|nr:ABC transporter substrate-binding protein [Lachnospiraceae bacterium]